MLRDNACNNFVIHKLSMFGPYDICFCNSCMQDDHDDDTTTKGTSFVFLYPRYEYFPESDATTMKTQAAERLVHQYLVRLERLPRPLPSDMLTIHENILGNVLCSKRVVSGKVLSADIRKYVQSESLLCDTLILNFCGHGAMNCSFITSTGKPLPQEDIVAWLIQARFSGTVICVFNMCHAERLLASTHISCNAGWNPSLPFRWIHLYSCDWDETQKVSHAHHVVRLLQRLMTEKPLYASLQSRSDELWVETRDVNQSFELWRGPPNISMGARYSGRFSDNASLTEQCCNM